MNAPAIGLLLIFTVMTVAVLRVVGVTPRRSLSQHIAKSSRTILFGKFGLTIGGVLFTLALSNYFFIGGWFVAVVVTAAAAGTLTGYLPYNVSKYQNLWHDIFSYGYVVCNPVILVMIWLALPNGGLRQLYAGGILLQLFLIGLLMFVRPARKYFLYGQVAFLLIFACLLVVS